MLAWAREVVKKTPGCDLPPDNRPPLESDPPAILFGFERLNDAMMAIMGLAMKLGKLPTRDEADVAATAAISKARSQDIRISHQTDAQNRLEESEDRERPEEG
jgi:hypothetical protein